jgi:hypothetical protein
LYAAAVVTADPAVLLRTAAVVIADLTVLSSPPGGSVEWASPKGA